MLLLVACFGYYFVIVLKLRYCLQRSKELIIAFRFLHILKSVNFMIVLYPALTTSIYSFEERMTQ